MKPKAIVLLSAGLDSTTNLYLAQREMDVVSTLTFDYGQKAAAKEIECAKNLSEKCGVRNEVISLPWLKNLGKSSLTTDQKQVPKGNQVSIENSQVSLQTAKSVWVPNRNGIFLNIAAAYAESLGAHCIIPGFNAEEAATFPDNSYDFIRSLRKSFTYSTQNHVDVQCFTVNMSKTEIVKIANDLMIPFKMIWPCYQNLEQWCGECESCMRAKRAFRVNRVDILGNFLV